MVTRYSLIFDNVHSYMLTIERCYSYPGQTKVGGDAKTPNILYYHQTGKMRAAGAEALQESIAEQVEEENWFKSEW
jgi:hypothetical protein